MFGTLSSPEEEMIFQDHHLSSLPSSTPLDALKQFCERYHVPIEEYYPSYSSSSTTTTTTTIQHSNTTSCHDDMMNNISSRNESSIRYFRISFQSIHEYMIQKQMTCQISTTQQSLNHHDTTSSQFSSQQQEEYIQNILTSIQSQCGHVPQPLLNDHSNNNNNNNNNNNYNETNNYSYTTTFSKSQNNYYQIYTLPKSVSIANLLEYKNGIIYGVDISSIYCILSLEKILLNSMSNNTDNNNNTNNNTTSINHMTLSDNHKRNDPLFHNHSLPNVLDICTAPGTKSCLLYDLYKCRISNAYSSLESSLKSSLESSIESSIESKSSPLESSYSSSLPSNASLESSKSSIPSPPLLLSNHYHPNTLSYIHTITGIDNNYHRIMTCKNIFKKYHLNDIRLIYADGTRYSTLHGQPTRMKRFKYIEKVKELPNNGILIYEKYGMKKRMKELDVKHLKKRKSLNDDSHSLTTVHHEDNNTLNNNSIISNCDSNIILNNNNIIPNHSHDSNIISNHDSNIVPNHSHDSNIIPNHDSNIILNNNSIISNHNTNSTMNIPQNIFESLSPLYDIVIVDAECSTDGRVEYFRNNLKQIQYTLENMEHVVNLQKQLLENAFVNCLKPCDESIHKNSQYGILLYCTCSFTVEQNENVIQYLLDKYQSSRENTSSTTTLDETEKSSVETESSCSSIRSRTKDPSNDCNGSNTSSVGSTGHSSREDHHRCEPFGIELIHPFKDSPVLQYLNIPYTESRVLPNTVRIMPSQSQSNTCLYIAMLRKFKK